MNLEFLNKIECDEELVLQGFGKSSSCSSRNNTWHCDCDCDCHDEGVCQCADCTGNCDDCW